MKYRLIAILLFFSIRYLSYSQVSGIIIDKITNEPISNASIYTKINNAISGTVSDDNGKYKINFPFNIIVISHINYNHSEIVKEQLSDTIYLTPKTISLKEITVKNNNPLWLNEILVKVVKQKHKKYQTSDKIMAYDYNTQTLSNTNGYAFQSQGNLFIPSFSINEGYKINPLHNVVKVNDNSKSPDFEPFRYMVYDEFLKEFNNNFIKRHKFRQNSEFKNNHNNLVKLSFSSEKHSDFKGYVIIDTLDFVITEFEIKAGTNYNIENNTTAIYRKFAESKGFKYTDWNTYINVKYGKVNDSYQPLEFKYKLYRKNNFIKDKVHKTFFSNIEATLLFSNMMASNDFSSFIFLPKPYSISIVNKKTAKAEYLLKRVKCSNMKF